METGGCNCGTCHTGVTYRDCGNYCLSQIREEEETAEHIWSQVITRILYTCTKIEICNAR